jgi:hypothetical protein
VFGQVSRDNPQPENSWFRKNSEKNSEKNSWWQKK